MSKKALLIDYEFCSNCHTCEVLCQIEHGLEPGVQNGIKVFEVGPWQIEGDNWQLWYMPVPTDLRRQLLHWRYEVRHRRRTCSRTRAQGPSGHLRAEAGLSKGLPFSRCGVGQDSAPGDVIH